MANTLRERLQAALSDLDSAIVRKQDSCRSEIEALKRKQALLKQAGLVINDDIEEAFRLLKSLGIDL